MNCVLSEETLSAYTDDELAPRDRAAAQSHIAECPRCSGNAGFFRGLKTSLKGLPSTPMPSDLKDRLLAEARRIDAAGEATALRPRLLAGPQDAFVAWVGSWPGRLALSGTAAAAAVLFFILSGPVEPVTVPLDVILSAHSEFVRDVRAAAGVVYE